MVIGTCKIYLRAEWVSSLKEKRMIVKSILERTKHKFNVSIAEVEDQDVHKSIVLGFACVTNDRRHAQNMVRNTADFIEFNTDAEVVDILVEIL